MTLFDNEIVDKLVEPLGTDLEEGVYWGYGSTEVAEVSSSYVV